MQGGPRRVHTEILTTELDLVRVHEELAALDTDGHYARPDVFELRVDARSRPGVSFLADDDQ